MAQVEGEIIIKRPVEVVFDFVADERNEPRYNPKMLRAEKVSAGPIGRGTRFQAASRSMGRTVPMTIEFTDFERPRQLTSSTQVSGMAIEGTLTFTPLPEGTRMRWSWHIEPQGVFKVMTPLVAQMGRRQERTIWTSLKHYLEADAAATPTQSEAANVGPTQ